MTIEFTLTLEDGLEAQILDEHIAQSWAEPASMYFPVVRTGISEGPIQMRFGRCLWQQTAGGKRHLITLVSQEGDTEETRGGGWIANLHQPQVSRLQDAAVLQDSRFEGLLSELMSAGVLDSESIERIRNPEVDQATLMLRRRQFSRALDLDEYWRD